MEPLWTITLFAELTIRPGTDSASTDTVRRFRSQKVASLLAYLAFHRGRAITREFLCDLLWPDEPDTDVTRNRFRVALTSLRRQLEPPGVPAGAVIENIGNNQVRLRAETVATDVAAFEAAARSGATARALSLYRGPLLPAFYEEWILGEQERLAAIFAQLDATEHPTEELDSVLAVSDSAAITSVRKNVPIPLYLTRFFGRDVERVYLNMLLADPQARLITLTGPGGIGKTRLASESVRDDPTLCAFVPLADIWDASQLGDALRQALQLPPAPNGDALRQVIEHINKEPKVRIVLDNVEQIAQGTALIVGELLARAPGLFLVITSRRRLDFPGEREVIVAPLSLPKSDVLEKIAVAPSVQLFLDRARSVSPDYQITPRNSDDISALCHLLDGIPLALELAAARAGTLTPGQIRTRLAERMGSDPITSTIRQGRVERHRSMNAVVAWSYELLPPDLRRFFLALSVFRGGWDISAAEAVTGEVHALDFLSRLRGHSLVTPEGGRFRLLETLRSWAEDLLRNDPERDVFLRRHAEYYRDMGELFAAQAGASNEKQALEVIEDDEANLRVAFAYTSGDNGSDAETALRIALVLYALGRARGSLSETLRTLYRALALANTHKITNKSLHARTLLAAGELTQLARGTAPARTLLAAALPLTRLSGDTALIARALRGLADNALLGEDYDTALPLYQEALTLQRERGDERGIAQTLNSLALLAQRHRNDFTEAARLTRESGDYFRRIGDTRMLSYNLFNLGELALEQDETADAESYFRESLTLAEELRDDWQRLYALFALARTAGRRNQDSTRRALIAEVLPLALRIGDLPVLADALREQARIVRDDGDLRRAVTLLSACHTITQQEAASAEAVLLPLPERSFRAAWDQGTTLTPEAAVELALSQTPSKS